MRQAPTLPKEHGAAQRHTELGLPAMPGAGGSGSLCSATQTGIGRTLSCIGTHAQRSPPLESCVGPPPINWRRQRRRTGGHESQTMPQLSQCLQGYTATQIQHRTPAMSCHCATTKLPECHLTGAGPSIGGRRLGAAHTAEAGPAHNQPSRHAPKHPGTPEHSHTCRPEMGLQAGTTASAALDRPRPIRWRP